MLCFVLDLSALVVQVFATILMFFNSHENRPQTAMIGFDVREEMKISKRKNSRLRVGFLILCVGFVIQIVSLVVKGIE